jgi:hypothetical protein
MTAVIVTPSIERDWLPPLGALRMRGVASVVCLLDRAAYDAHGRRSRGLPAQTAELLAEQDRVARAMIHALAEYDVPVYPIVPGRKLGELLVGQGAMRQAGVRT